MAARNDNSGDGGFFDDTSWWSDDERPLEHLLGFVAPGFRLVYEYHPMVRIHGTARGDVEMPVEEKSISWVIGGLMLLIAGFGWGFLAASYSEAHNPRTFADGSTQSSGDDFRIRRRPSATAVLIGSIYRFVKSQSLI